MPQGSGSVATRNRAFSALNRALRLPGAENLTNVDLSVASPTLDLTRMMEASLVTRWEFFWTRQFAGPGFVNTLFRPWVAVDFDQVNKWSQPQPAGIAVPRDEDMYITGFGVTINPPEVFTDASLALGSPLLLSVTTAFQPLWRANGNVLNVATWDNGPPWVQGPPIFLRAQDPGSSAIRPDFRFRHSAGISINAWMTVVSAPPGILPRGPLL